MTEPSDAAVRLVHKLRTYGRNTEFAVPDKVAAAEIDSLCNGRVAAERDVALRALDERTAERDAMMAALRETEPVMALVRRINAVVLRSNGVGKSECTVDIECADYEDALDLFDLIEELAAHSAATKPEAK